MSLIRQIWLLMLGTVLLAFLGSVTVAVESARNYLETQLQLLNSIGQEKYIELNSESADKAE